MTDHDLQIAIDRMLEAVKTFKPAYDSNLHTASFEHLKRLYAIQAQRAGIIKTSIVKPGEIYEIK